MNLKDYFLSNAERNMIHKPMSYFDIYESHFRKYVNTKVKVLEIGVAQGGSVKMWKEYFGKDSEIIGIDINPKCKKFEEQGIRIYIGDQADAQFLNQVVNEEHEFDIIIDDGGHFVNQQIVSFKTLIPFVNNEGKYMVEDVGTNYKRLYGGGLRNPGTFIELSKRYVDEVNAYSSDEIEPSFMTENITGIHFHDSIICFDKGKRQEHDTRMIGIVTI